MFVTVLPFFYIEIIKNKINKIYIKRKGNGNGNMRVKKWRKSLI